MKTKHVIKLESSKPRNWTVLALAGKTGGGVHRKSNKAQRQQGKQSLRRNSEWF